MIVTDDVIESPQSIVIQEALQIAKSLQSHVLKECWKTFNQGISYIYIMIIKRRRG